MELYDCVKELAMKCGLQPNLKTDSYRAINRTGTLKKAMKNINGFIHSKIYLSVKITSVLLRQKDFMAL